MRWQKRRMLRAIINAAKDRRERIKDYQLVS